MNYIYKVRAIVQTFTKKTFYEVNVLEYVIERETNNYYFFDRRRIEKSDIKKLFHEKSNLDYRVTMYVMAENIEEAKSETLKSLRLYINEDLKRVTNVINLIKSDPEFNFRSNKDSYQ